MFSKLLKYSLRGYEGQRQMLTSCSLFLLRYAVHVDNADFRYGHVRSFYVAILAITITTSFISKS